LFELIFWLLCVERGGFGGRGGVSVCACIHIYMLVYCAPPPPPLPPSPPTTHHIVRVCKKRVKHGVHTRKMNECGAAHDVVKLCCCCYIRCFALFLLPFRKSIKYEGVGERRDLTRKDCTSQFSKTQKKRKKAIRKSCTPTAKHFLFFFFDHAVTNIKNIPRRSKNERNHCKCWCSPLQAN
jgi:hypothetical protein